MASIGQSPTSQGRPNPDIVPPVDYWQRIVRSCRPFVKITILLFDSPLLKSSASAWVELQRLFTLVI